MTNEAVHKFMENEICCMQRESKGVCTRDCNECEFDRVDDLLRLRFIRIIFRGEFDENK